MRKVLKKLTILGIAACMLLSFGETVAAAKKIKPSKVSLKTISYERVNDKGKTQLIFKKAKNAKKYRVKYMTYKKKKRVKTVTKTYAASKLKTNGGKLVINAPKVAAKKESGVTYKVQVQSISKTNTKSSYTTSTELVCMHNWFTETKRVKKGTVKGWECPTCGFFSTNLDEVCAHNQGMMDFADAHDDEITNGFLRENNLNLTKDELWDLIDEEGQMADDYFKYFRQYIHDNYSSRMPVDTSEWGKGCSEYYFGCACYNSVNATRYNYVNTVKTYCTKCGVENKKK